MSNNEKHRVFAYIRVATQEQLSESHQRQLLAEQFRQHPDWELVHAFCAIGYRGSKGCKAGQQEALRRCKTAGADTILVSKLEIIDRHAVGVLRFVDEATAQGIRIEVATGAGAYENEILKAVREVLRWLDQ